MITLRIKYADSTVNITFPCTENTLAAKLMELHASDHEGDPFFVEEVIEPRDIAPFFETQFVDLDEVNYLAKRMESFIAKEMNQFFAASTLEGHSTVKDLINLTFSLERYTLVRDVSNLQKVGASHIDEPTLSSDTINKYETIEITVRTDSWDERNAYDLIPLDLYFDGEWIERVYLSFEKYGVVTYTFDFNIGGFAGEHEILIRINEDDYQSETDPTNNEVIATVTVLNNYELSISPIPIDDSYTEGTTVITGFTVFNDSDTDLLPSDRISACFEVYYMDGTTVVYLTEQYWDQVIAPMGNANLIYFKWTVPKKFAGKTLICRCTVDPEGFLNGDTADNNTASFETVIAAHVTSQTENTRYESKAPSGYGSATVPDAQSNGLSWNQWEYENGTFVLKEYGVRIVLSPIVTPEANCKTAIYQNGVWSIKSGYGITLSLTPILSSYGTFELPSSDALTSVQSASALLPEYMYSAAVDTYRTLELVNGSFCFAENSEADENARVHFLPVYLMDGNYTVCVTAGEVWTPVGKLSAIGHANTVNVGGTIYDDYYVGN